MSKPALAPMQLVSKPKNARSKRAAIKKEAKLRENPKTAIFVRGQSTSEAVKVALSELMQLKKPEAISFSKSNAIHPFEDSTSLAFWSKKNDASLFLVGLHSKKRPNNLIFARTFDNEVMDMLELGIEKVRSMSEYKGAKAAVGQRPLFHFSGDLFNTHPLYQQFKSIILDFFHGDEIDKINLAGLEHVISCTIGAQSDEVALASAIPTQPITDLASSSATSSASTSSALPLVHFRTFSTKLLNSGVRTPLVGLESIGPDFDFRLRRTQVVDQDMWKQATKKPKKAVLPGQIAGQKRKDRNIDIDEMGDKVGRLHVGKQDLSKLQSRKMKGLKAKNDVVGMEEEGEQPVVDIPSAGGRKKKVRVAEE